MKIAERIEFKIDSIYDALFPFGSSIASGMSIEMEISESKEVYNNLDYWYRGMYCNLYHRVD